MAKVTYTNHLNFIANKRVLADRLLTKKDTTLYIENGIYYHYDDKIVNNKCSILIMGSFDNDNPYYGGFYLFNGIYPDNYPFSPPLMKAKTQGDNIRFHPNFYDEWKSMSIYFRHVGRTAMDSSSQNIGSVACSVKSLFIKEPIHQEPGWEKCNPLKSKTYSQIITYKNLEIAVYDVVKLSGSSDSIYFPYRTVIEKKFLELYPSYVELIHNI